MSAPSKQHILVVDDEKSIRETVAQLLRVRGYEVATPKDGFDALLQLRRVIPTVIISDPNMPNMSGFEFLSVVRRRFPQISVIAMSGALLAIPQAISSTKSTSSELPQGGQV
jgi:CheY-like chemotaxis protein